MYNKSDEKFLIIQDTFEANKQDTNDKQMKNDEKITQITSNLKALTAFIMYQTNNWKLSPAQKDTLTPPDPTTVVPAIRRAPLLDGGHYGKFGDIWTLKHGTSSLEFYEILIKT